tara:strand:+ start:36693 stop:37079 length:387 start_codon:yes stop_codon:yes gene_type:complete
MSNTKNIMGRVGNGTLKNELEQVAENVESLKETILSGNILGKMKVSEVEELIEAIEDFQVNSTVLDILDSSFSKVKEYRTENPLDVKPEPEISLKQNNENKRRASNKMGSGNRPSLKLKQDENDDEVS